MKIKQSICNFLVRVYTKVKKYTCKSKNALVNENFLFYVIILIIWSSSAIMYNVNLNDIKDYYEISITLQKHQEFESVWLLLNEKRAKAKTFVAGVANQIQNDIQNTCDMDTLENELAAGIISDQLEEIFRSNLQGNYFSGVQNSRNDLFICTKDKIIADYSYNTANEGPYDSWDDFLLSYSNKPLSEDTIQKLRDQDDTGLLITEREGSLNPNHILYDHIGKDELRKVYMEEGLEGLSTYSFLVPAYITKYGDIFGKPDIISGHRVDNNKLIVVQQINIYDQIMNSHSDYSVEGSKTLSIYYNKVIINLYLLGIFLSIALIGLIVLVCYRINRSIDVYETNQLKKDEP